MARRRHHKAEDLAAKAQQIIEDGLAANQTYEAIAEKVRAETDESISTSAIGRYHSAKVRPRVEATKQANEIAREMAAMMGDATDAELRDALARRTALALFPMLEELARKKPDMAGFFLTGIEGRRLEELKIRQRAEQLELRRSQHELDKKLAEQKLSEMERKAAAAALVANKKDATPDQLKQAIWNIYGVDRSPEPPPSEKAA